MAFHETYWAVTGAAAPVLGLAAVLSIGDLARVQERVGGLLLELDDDEFGLPKHSLLPGRLTDAESAGYARYERLLDDRSRRLRRQFVLVTALLLVQVSNVFAQAVLLAVSLWAIGTHRNQGSPWLWGIIAVAGLAVLSLAGLEGMSVRVHTFNFEFDKYRLGPPYRSESGLPILRQSRPYSGWQIFRRRKNY